jgi:hypothetical protein
LDALGYGIRDVLRSLTGSSHKNALYIGSSAIQGVSDIEKAIIPYINAQNPG